MSPRPSSGPTLLCGRGDINPARFTCAPWQLSSELQFRGASGLR